MIDFTEDEIRQRVTATEDNYVERKTAGGHTDWVKTVVGFANTAPIGHPCLLLIGVKDDGTIEDHSELEKLQQQFNGKMKAVYPPIYYRQRVVEKNGKQFIAVTIPGSEARPHFSGHAYMRRGAHTIEASEEQYKEFVARRTGKANEILNWKGKVVTIGYKGRAEFFPEGYTVVDCNEFWATLEHGEKQALVCFPLNQIELNFHPDKQRLKIMISPF